MPATRIDPIKLADALGAGSPLGRAIGIDAMRYYLLREMPLGNDGDFTFESLFGRFNAELANDLGNLINRSLTLIAKFVGRHAAGPRRLGVQRRRESVLAARDRTRSRPAARRGAVRGDRAVARARGDLAVRRRWRTASSIRPSRGRWRRSKDPALGHALWCAAGEPVADRAADRAGAAGDRARSCAQWIGDADAAMTLAEPVDGRVLPLAPATCTRARRRRCSRGSTTSCSRRSSTIVPPDAAARRRRQPRRRASRSPPTPSADARAAATPSRRPPHADHVSTTSRRSSCASARCSPPRRCPKAKKLLHLTVDLGEAGAALDRRGHRRGATRPSSSSASR